ncbi:MULTISPECIES: acyl carrier protein [Chryseobacterium]|jgi:acyl carrier protein|uniref:Acyl carrier protein n=1 Tax=Chryseobacterium geocarposphaerae TaxID=1416776 RepID=A0ABU1LF77_9FLAO|nr:MULTISPECIES: acyl carrier protein [Chryseobacterium]ALR31850.1 hypothetical protein ATE47_15610 [Chryseobacterium sp. IHB B 17019]MDR6405370.1 acyl carrier protein [Chryseobacterium geocarposphaerae]MDR6697529.1 acyl carrier protein [Chryseobacterium ginsenosidimutans]
MKIEQFCELLQQELNEETAITPETNFKELESYGSLSAVLVMKLVEDQFDTEINPRSFRNINTVNDIADAIGREKFN